MKRLRGGLGSAGVGDGGVADGEDRAQACVEGLWWVWGLKAQRLQAAGEDGLGHWCG